MRYRGNKICPDERTNKQTSRTDRPKHNDFTDIVEWPRHKNYDQSSITESNLAASMTRTSQSVNCWVSGRFFHTAADTDWLLTTVHCLATNLHSSTHHQYDTIMACKCYFRSLPSAQFHMKLVQRHSIQLCCLSHVFTAWCYMLARYMLSSCVCPSVCNKLKPYKDG